MEKGEEEILQQRTTPLSTLSLNELSSLLVAVSKGRAILSTTIVNAAFLESSEVILIGISKTVYTNASNYRFGLLCYF
ncbi:hypothetical protein D5086_026820 [Populus alba]|uniref:Uncharacterized protein n=1 Tax=Populus alba TaxID=43335 RepID=A0ACC4B3N4_POPAL